MAMTQVKINRVKWQRVVGYEDQYEVSTEGIVRSLPRQDSRGRNLSGRVLKPTINKDGYPYVTLTKESWPRKFYCHQLVLLAFKGPCPEGMEVRHLDGNPGNKRLNNLEYGTRQDNRRDAILHGTTRAKPVLRSDGKWFRSIQEAAAASGCSHATVINSINETHQNKHFDFELA